MRDLNVFNTRVTLCCHSVFQQMEFPVENGAASPHYIILVQWLVIIQMQFVLAVDSINILLEHSAQNTNCVFHFNSKVYTVEVWSVYCASLVWLALMYFSCHIFPRCFCLIFHLRNKERNDLTELLPLLRCPIMDFPSRYP